MMRISVRLDLEYIDKLEVIKYQEHLTTTEVIKKVLTYYYEMKRRRNSTKIQQLLESDYIACCDGFDGLSKNYKDHLTNLMSKKYELD